MNLDLKQILEKIKEYTHISGRESIVTSYLLNGFIDPNARDKYDSSLRKLFAGFANSESEAIKTISSIVINGENSDRLKKNCRSILNCFINEDDQDQAQSENEFIEWISNGISQSPLYMSEEDIALLTETLSLGNAVEDKNACVLYNLFRITFSNLSYNEIFEKNMFYSALTMNESHPARAKALELCENTPLALTIAANAENEDVRRKWNLYFAAAEQKEPVALWNLIYYIRIKFRTCDKPDADITKEDLRSVFRQNYVRRRITEVSNCPDFIISDEGAKSVFHKKSAMLLYSMLKNDSFAKSAQTLALMFMAGEVSFRLFEDGKEISQEEIPLYLMKKALKMGDVSAVRTLVGYYSRNLSAMSDEARSIFKSTFEYQYVLKLMDLANEFGYYFQVIRLKSLLFGIEMVDSSDVKKLEQSIAFSKPKGQKSIVYDLLNSIKEKNNDKDIDKLIDDAIYELDCIKESKLTSFMQDVDFFLGSHALLAQYYYEKGDYDKTKHWCDEVTKFVATRYDQQWNEADEKARESFEKLLKNPDYRTTQTLLNNMSTPGNSLTKRIDKLYLISKDETLVFGKIRDEYVHWTVTFVDDFSIQLANGKDNYRDIVFNEAEKELLNKGTVSLFSGMVVFDYPEKKANTLSKEEVSSEISAYAFND